MPITARVILGVPEPPEWVKQRRTRVEEQDALVCPSNKGHQPMGHRDVVCIKCGRATVPGKRTVTLTLKPTEVYGDAGVYPSMEGVFFGITLSATPYRYGIQSSPIPEPTEEQVAWLKTFLDELGYEGEAPALYLVVEP